MIDTYLGDPVIKDHLDRRLVLVAQLIGTAQAQTVSAYWTLAQHGKVSSGFIDEAKKYLRDALAILDTI